MRIGQMISGPGLDGTARYCQLITQALAARGHEVTLFHRPGAWIAGHFDGTGVRRVEVSFARTRAELGRVRSLVREHAIDVIHTHHTSADSFGMLLWFRGVRRVATGHNRHIHPHWLFLDRLIAPTPEVARFHNRFSLVPKKRIAVIPNFIDVRPFLEDLSSRRAKLRAELGVDEGCVLAGMVGALVPRKRHADLVSALAVARRRAPNLKLVLAGAFADDAVLAAVRETVAKAGLERDVILRIAEPDIVGLFSALDIYAFSSNFEAGPLSILEAMAAGRPVVSADVGASRLFVAEGETGAVVPFADTARLGEALADLALDADRRRRFGAAGRERVTQLFSLEAAGARLEQVLAEAAARGR